MKTLALFLAPVFTVIALSHFALGEVVKKGAVAESRYLEYEGVLTDPSGASLSGEHVVVFRIYDSPSSGVPLWEETHRAAVASGELRVILGRQALLPPLSSGSSYLGVFVNGEELSPRQLLSVEPGDQALRIAPPGTQLITPPPHLAGFFDDRFVNETGDTMSGNLIVNANVGIGTESPLARLEVEGTGNPVLHVWNSAGGSALTAQGDGASASTAYGLLGIAHNTASGNAYGVRGFAENSSDGLAYGGIFLTSETGTGSHYGLQGEGWGSTSGSTFGVSGLAQSTGSGVAYGGYFTASSTGTGARYGLRADGSSESSAAAYGTYGYAENSSTGSAYGGRFYASTSGSGTHYGVYAYEAAGGTGAAVYASGDMIASGAKPAVVRTSRGHRLLYAQESPEVWFEDFGRAHLVNGKAHVELDPLFLETVTIDSEHPVEVFIQLRGDCRGAYVETSDTGFDVFELEGGTSDAPFSYRVVAKRKGYEDERFRGTDVGHDDPNLYPELREEMDTAHREPLREANLEEVAR